MSEQDEGAGRPSDDDAPVIIDLLRDFTTVMDRYIGVHGGAQGLHRTDLHALAAVLDASREGRALAPGELSGALGLSPPATSALLRRLETVGHVRRTHSTSDRRRISIEMTDEAMGVAGQVFGPIAGALRAAIARYSPEEQALVVRFLGDVVQAAEEATAAGSGGARSGNG